jgi:Flavin-binding monooxygenase-like
MDLLFNRTLSGPSINDILKDLSRSTFGDLQRFGFGEAPEPLTTPISINGNVVESLTTKQILHRHRLKKVTGAHSVEFEDGNTLDGIDVIILATGYHADFSICKFLVCRADIVSNLKYTGQVNTEDEKLSLYRNMVSLEAPYSLGFVGHSFGLANPTTYELQSRYLAQLYKGSISLPSIEQMKIHIGNHHKFISMTKRTKDDSSPINPVEYLEWIAKEIGCDFNEHLDSLPDLKLKEYLTKGVISGHAYR